MADNLTEFFNATQNMTRAIEILSVLEGQKPVARIAVHDDLLEKIDNVCKKFSLFAIQSKFRIKLNFSGDYSTKGTVSKEGHHFLYISKDEKLALQAKIAEETLDHEALGILLGYPKCCTKFFIKHTADESKLHNDFVMPCINNSKDFIFQKEINIFARYFDVSLLSHCPHSFDCKLSLDLAAKRLEIIKKHSPEIADQILDLLHSAVVYDNGKIHLLTNIKYSHNILHFEHVLSTEKDTLSRKLSLAKRITVKSKSNFILKDEKYSLPTIIFV